MCKRLSLSLSLIPPLATQQSQPLKSPSTLHGLLRRLPTLATWPGQLLNPKHCRGGRHNIECTMHGCQMEYRELDVDLILRGF